ncbi:R3H and coiled-coil domain-containing protein 1 isoform X2 [Haemorhous mexicanus]|uniref:R3H and coiled-coil domain-containing protein 1 isoform X2 n=1 Tax=Haemorhous mexicanus TaxID=30427 RepID=UPI0028BF40FC|nr:R3H and coiled-coil domain-containing protein 1 isoform X2 [Haemorhous mexicanus]
MDGVFLSPSEDEFVGRIVEELEHFLEQGQHHRVLLFPPLSSRLRYLIHRTVESMELLSSFSVGEGWRRRTVICHSAVRLPTETSSEQRAGTNPARAQRPPQPWGRGGRGARPRHPGGDTYGDSPRATVGSGRITRPPRRKPERALYVPRGSRKKENWRERESPGDGDAAPGGENCPRNSSREQQDQGRAGGSPGKQQEPEGVPGKGGAEHPLCAGKEPPPGNGSDPWEQGSRGGDCAHCPGSAHGKQPPEAGQEELSPGSAIVPGQEPNPGSAIVLSPGSAIVPGQEEPSPGSAIVPGQEPNPGSAIVLSPGSAIVPGQEEPSPGSAIVPGQEPSPGSAIVLSPGSAIDPGQELSPGSAIDPEGSELQELQEEKESSRDPGGAECGRSSVPLEHHGGSRTALPVTAPGVTAPGVTALPMTAPGVTDPGVTALPVTDPAMTDQPVPAPAVPAPPELPSQPLQSSQSQAPRALQDSQAVPTQGSPSAGQVEQKVLEGPAEALAAPELLLRGDPGWIHGRKEEEEDEEGSGVAEALRRGLDVAAGDREGTRQSGLEDDCTAELLAEIVGNLTVKEISVERISVDCSGCGEPQLSQGHLGHVTEIYDFPPTLRTEDLLGIFSEFLEGGFRIQWVDETHALGIFSSLSSASQALGRRYPCLKIRPLLHASRQAKSCCSWARRGRRQTRPWPGDSCPTPWAGGSGSRSPQGVKNSRQNPWNDPKNPPGLWEERGCAGKCLQSRGACRDVGNGNL